MPKKKILLINEETNTDYLQLYNDYVKEKSCTSAKATIRGLKYKILPFLN